MNCKRCSGLGYPEPRARVQRPALQNSDWCRACWQAWWKSIELLSYLQHQRATAKRPVP